MKGEKQDSYRNQANIPSVDEFFLTTGIFLSCALYPVKTIYKNQLKTQAPFLLEPS